MEPFVVRNLDAGIESRVIWAGEAYVVQFWDTDAGLMLPTVVRTADSVKAIAAARAFVGRE